MRERPAAVDGDDVDLFIGIVDTARKHLERHYPGSEFHVLQWGEEEEGLSALMWRKLAERGIRVHRYLDILPDAAENGRKYILSEHDVHPNALAHERLANYVAEVVANGDRTRREDAPVPARQRPRASNGESGT
jgi:hypothetical protein